MKALTNEEFIAAIDSKTASELNELIRLIRDRFHIPEIVQPLALSKVELAPPVEEQTEFSVIIKDVGPKKIQVIKVVRIATKLGLQESKDLVEGTLKTVKEGISKADAGALKKQLEENGATVEIV